MRQIARMLGVAGLVATSVLGGTVAANAQQTTSGTTMGVQASGQDSCGYDYNRCVENRQAYIRFGYGVSDIFYREGQTCPGGGPCADGYYFNWWD